MKSIIALFCLLAVVAVSHAVPSGWGGYGYAAPVAVVRPVLRGPLISGWGSGWGGYGAGRGWDGQGLGRGWGGYGLAGAGWGSWGGRGWGGRAWGGRGSGGQYGGWH